MREADFRTWLSRRAYQGTRLTAKGVSSRVRKAPRIERALQELGFAETDLDDVYANGRWPELVSAVNKVAADWQSNEAAARKMAPQATDPTRQLNNLRNTARQYGHFAAGKDPNYDAEGDGPERDENEEIDEVALEALKARFLDKHPDFERGGGFPGHSGYHPDEDDYKRPTIAAAAAIIAGASPGEASNTAIGGQLLDLVLEGDTNLIGDYRRKSHLKAVRQRPGNKLAETVGRLALSTEAPPEAAARFVADAWPDVLRGSEHSKPYGDIRTLATLFQAFARPQDAISIATRKFEHLSKALLGRRMFADDVLSAGEYRAVLDLAGEVRAALESWGWQPRDLWDVQGFIWVTCEEKPDMDATSDADRIRRYALETYVTPARRRGEATVTIRCGDVHNGLGMANAHANVCQALRGRKFQELAGVDVPTSVGPDNSSTTTFTYVLGAAAGASSSAGGSGTPRGQAPTNLILYGPPGTGKTFRTATEAVKLCDGSAPADRTELMARYRELVSDERIGFVTFHQSFAYEDFVEGLRPTTLDEEGNEIATGFRLQAEAGIFRKFAEAAKALGVEEATASFDLEGRNFFKMSLGEVANAEDDYLFEEAIDGGFLHMGDDSGIDWSAAEFDSKMAMIDAYATKYPHRQILSKLSGPIEFPFTLRHRVKIGDIIIVSKGNLAFRAIGEVTGDYENVARDDDYTIRRSVRWLWVNTDGLSYDIINNKRFSQRTVYALAPSEIKVEAIQSLINSGLNAQSGEGRRTRNFVLIIDEINRANISKVFGELITLLEPDKRLDMPNALTVKLPYSKRDFGVPANLHIIGTMNTADRSLAQLDIALRRRFKFREVAPDPAKLPEQVDGVPLRRVLETINDRIEYLIDREHCIGHAFFMGDGGNSRAAIDATMRDKVIPLLQEYFIEDWGRVAAVLGEPAGKGGGFLNCRALKDPTGQDGETRESWSVRLVFAAGAYDQLVGKPSAEAPGAVQGDPAE